jgi:porphobilinogen deaminase
VGAWARFTGDLLHLGACVLGPNGEGITTITTRAVADAAEMPEALGRRVAEDLLRQGADDLLALGREAEALRRQG